MKVNFVHNSQINYSTYIHSYCIIIHFFSNSVWERKNLLHITGEGSELPFHLMHSCEQFLNSESVAHLHVMANQLTVMQILI